MQGRTAVAQELTSLAWNLGKLESIMYMYMYNQFYNYTMLNMMPNFIFSYNLLLSVVQ